ncbi:MAG TPA: glycosyltransferase family 2 protein [Thermoanaerobaculia bacterium]|jgi:glycosyltransferase involved in cell wall biosynthesis|nr:glycosyltransferase family 2 protein [Thermoanaerobaculia bacterium]
MSVPYFSVVIPTYKRLPMLIRVLDALDAQQAAPEFEVIVIDDGSGDETADVMQARRANQYALTFQSQPNSGPGRARNRGVALATGRYVLFIGDDTVPEPEFFAQHARSHGEAGDDPHLACLGYTGWPAGERVTAFMDYINDFGLQFGYKLIHDGEIVPFNFFYTSNISIDRQLLGPEPFDTTFPAAAWEDIELAFRLDALGLKIRYNAQAITRHYHPMTVDSFARRQYTVGRSGAIFYRKHPELAGFLGVHELETRTLANDNRLAHLRRRARLGERFRLLATNRVFETLMREHYLRGLRDGLAAASPASNHATSG